MSELHLRQPEFKSSSCRSFKETNNFKKHDIQDTFIETNLIKHAFDIIWIMEILKICLEEQLLIKYYMMKHLILLKTGNMMGIKKVLLQWFTYFLVKIILVELLHVHINLLLKMRFFRASLLQTKLSDN